MPPLNPSSVKAIQDFISAPVHALLLSGAAGSGKQAVARSITSRLVNADFETYAYKTVIQPEADKPYGIDTIRQIEHILSLRVPSQQSINRVLIIEDAHKLTREAQNALLKTLEEPPAGTVIIMNSTDAQSLLPTVRSRMRTISLLPPSSEQLLTHFRQHPEAEVKRAYTMTGGLPGLMQAMLEDQEHPLREATEVARALLGESSYERMLRVDGLSKDKELTANTLFILQQMAHVSLRAAEGAGAERWARVLEQSYQTSEALQQSAQPKLALTKLMLSL